MNKNIDDLYFPKGLPVSDDFARLNLIGNSPQFLAALRTLTRVAACDATALIHGETGTGKELIARALHYLSLIHI